MNLLVAHQATAAATTAAPWWGVPVVAGIFLLLGAILGFIFNRANETRKEAREDSKKWHGELRLEAAQLMSLAHQLDMDAPHLQSSRDAISGPQSADEITDYLELSEKVVADMTELVLVLSAIKIIAPKDVADMGGKVVDAAGEVITHHTKAASRNLNSEVTVFLEKVRQALGVKN